MKEELQFIKEKILSVYDEMMRLPLEIMDKGNFDTVTNIDYEIEKTLINIIKTKYPLDHVISEEFNPLNSLGRDRTWIIDPIDGTVNFSRGIVHFGIQLAFCVNSIPMLSVIYLPRLGELYYALAGQGAYLNEKPIHIIKRTVNQSIVSFGDFFVNDAPANKYQTHLFLKLKDHLFRTRVFGSAAVDFTMLASGRTDGVLLRTNNLWDLVPGYLLAKEAGTIFINEQGGEYKFTDYGLLAANNTELLKSYLDTLTTF